MPTLKSPLFHALPLAATLALVLALSEPAPATAQSTPGTPATPTATPADVVFTSLTSLRPAGEDVSNPDGTTGWPGAHYPSAPPLYAVRPGATRGTLFGGFTGNGLLGTRPSIYTAVGLYSMSAGVSIYERLAYDPATGLHGRVNSTPVRASSGALYGVMTSEYGQQYAGTDTPASFAYSPLVGRGLVFRTDFDGTYPVPVASTVGQLYEPNGALLIDAQDQLYGVDRGPRGNGRIFKVDLASGALGTVHEFDVGPQGMRQVANDLVWGTDGLIYGVTGYDRGLSGHPLTPNAPATPTGTLFRIDPKTPGSLTVLHTFTLAEGEINVADNVTTEGYLRYPGGQRLVLGEGGEVTQRALSAGQQVSRSSLVDGGDGYLYGGTSVADCYLYRSPNKALNLRRINTESPLCGYRQWPPTEAQPATLPYPYHDSPRAAGSIYRIAKAGGPLQFLHHFSETDGATPRGSMAVGADGAIYGTTLGGGAHYCNFVIPAGSEVRCGTIYRIKPSAIRVDAQGQVQAGGFELVHSFSGNDGNIPLGVRAAADGRIYGVTARGGSYKDSAGVAVPTQFGTVFQLAPTTAETPAGEASLVVTPAQIAAGESTTLTWTTTNASNCTAASTRSDWTGAVPSFGSVTLTPPAGTYRYTLTCNVAGNTGGAQVSATSTVFVSTPATAEDGNAVKYGNGGGGAFSSLLLAPLALAALGLRRRPARRGKPA